MLKTLVGNDTWLVQQPHHAQVSGYLAAHWGGANGFARPGHYPGATDPARWRDEVIVGIAEHDNGWWEWEAIPKISANDGLPVGLGEAVPNGQPNELDQWRAGGYDRWRVGIDRLQGPHPYGALLVSLHAYWLYAVEFPDLVAAEESALRHFIFSGRDGAPVLVGDREATRSFLIEQAAVQAELKHRLVADPVMAGAIAPEHLAAHLRLLQLMDSLSLIMAMNNRGEHRLPHVPRGAWDDCTTIELSWVSDREIALDPYPFALDPLPVHMPARIMKAGSEAERRANPYAVLHGAPLDTIEFWLTSGT